MSLSRALACALGVRRSILVLTAVAAAFVVPQAARADDPNARFYGSTDSTQTARWCETSWQWGVNGAYGAWGRYIDGCTASVQCPWSGCRVMQATGQLHASAYTTKTCNMAVRIYTASGSLRYRTDASSTASGDNTCWINRTAPNVWQGEWVTVQTNGVISNSSSAWGKVKSYVWLSPA